VHDSICFRTNTTIMCKHPLLAGIGYIKKKIKNMYIYIYIGLRGSGLTL